MKATNRNHIRIASIAEVHPQTVKAYFARSREVSPLVVRAIEQACRRLKLAPRDEQVSEPGDVA